MTTTDKTVLLGNAFPFPLIRRNVNVRVVSVESVRRALAGARVFSFWGHLETLPAAEKLLGISLRPASPRPAITLSPDGLPVFAGHAFDRCYVVSPDCRPGYRHAVGGELAAADITGWQTLRIDWI